MSARFQNISQQKRIEMLRLEITISHSIKVDNLFKKIFCQKILKIEFLGKILFSLEYDVFDIRKYAHIKAFKKLIDGNPCVPSDL